MTLVLAVDAANWPFPWGYGYRNIVGNVLASLLWAGPPFVAGVLVGRRRAARTDAHHQWMARQMANVHRATTGDEPEDHPHGWHAPQD